MREFAARGRAFEDAVVCYLDELLFALLLRGFAGRCAAQAERACAWSFVARVVKQRPLFARVALEEGRRTAGLRVLHVELVASEVLPALIAYVFSDLEVSGDRFVVVARLVGIVVSRARACAHTRFLEALVAKVEQVFAAHLLDLHAVPFKTLVRR